MLHIAAANQNSLKCCLTNFVQSNSNMPTKAQKFYINVWKRRNKASPNCHTLQFRSSYHLPVGFARGLNNTRSTSLVQKRKKWTCLIRSVFIRKTRSASGHSKHLEVAYSSPFSFTHMKRRTGEIRSNGLNYDRSRYDGLPREGSRLLL